MLKLLFLLPFLVNGSGGAKENEIAAEAQCYVPWSEYTQTLAEQSDKVEDPFEAQILQSYGQATACSLELAAETARKAAISCSANYADTCSGSVYHAATEWAVLTSLNAGETKKARDIANLYEDTYLSHMDSLSTSMKQISRYLLLSPRHFNRCPAQPNQNVFRTSITYDDGLTCEYWTADLTANFTKIVGGPDTGPIVFKLLEMTLYLALTNGNESATLETYPGLESAAIRYWEDDLGQSNVFITTHEPLTYTLFHASGYMDIGDLLAKSSDVITAADR